MGSQRYFNSFFRSGGVARSKRRAIKQSLSRSHNAVICVYDEAGSVIETHEHAGELLPAAGLTGKVSGAPRDSAS